MVQSLSKTSSQSDVKPNEYGSLSYGQKRLVLFDPNCVVSRNIPKRDSKPNKYYSLNYELKIRVASSTKGVDTPKIFQQRVVKKLQD
jgi:hypothetical protein